MALYRRSITAVQAAKGGFTLIDTVVAVAVIGIGMIGVFSLLVVAHKSYLLSRSRLTAVMLSQEGAELVRNVRDSNNLDPAANWNDGLAAGTYTVEYDRVGGAVVLAPVSNTNPLAIPAARLEDDGSYFTHSGSTPTRWYRTVTLAAADTDSNGAPDTLTVTAWVQWREYSQVREHKTIVMLYDWY